MADDTISRKLAIDATWFEPSYTDPLNVLTEVRDRLKMLPSAQPEEVIPHRNYKYLSDYWCKCGWHLGKKGNVKYCPECGRRVNWDG